jgi:hypothetical protein
MGFEFEWDPKKAEANLKRHRVAFDEALTVFADPLARIFDHPDHSTDETRAIIVIPRSSDCCWYPSPNERPRCGSSVHGRRPKANDKIMSKASKRNRRSRREDLRPEYRFDYRKSRSNRFASRMGRHAVAVVLEPDVAQVFDSSTSVNRLLRSVIAAVPPRRSRGVRRKAG